jgi:RNA polymerase sigma-70 factor (ECF subfamily)
MIDRTVTKADFASIFHEHKDSVYRFAWRMTGSASAADDVTQDCFAALLRGPDRYDPIRGSRRAFLIGVARNIIRNRWRVESRWDSLDEETFVAEPLDPSRLQTAEMVARAVQSLPPLQREVVILAEYEEMTMEEVARSVDAEVSAVKARLHRGRDNLRRMLAPLRKSTCNL